MKIIILFGFLLTTFPAAATPSGQLKASVDHYPSFSQEDETSIIPYLSLEIGDKYKLSQKTRFQFRGTLLGNLESKEQPEQIYADLPEAVFEWRLPGLRLRAGMNIINWGVVDINSPSDVVNPVAMFHPLRSYKRGAPMLEFDWSSDTFGVHAIYIPVQQRPLMPSIDSPWLPRSVLVNITAEGQRVLIPERLEYEYLEPEDVGGALRHNAGLRLSSHLGALDLYAMHFEGAHPSPDVRANVALDFTSVPGELLARTPVELSLVSYRVRTSSFAAVLARESWIFRLESAYQHTLSEDELFQPWSWSNVLAAETGLNVGTSTVTVLAQYYYTENPQAADNMLSSSYRLFDRTGLLGVRWPVSDPLTVTASVLYEGNTEGLFLMAGFEQKMSDALRWGLSWKDFSARQDGLLKTFDRNDHATLDLTYYF